MFKKEEEGGGGELGKIRKKRKGREKIGNDEMSKYRTKSACYGSTR